MTAILQHCQDAGLRCKTIPGLTDVIEGRSLTTQIRDVAVEDLLGRNPVHLDQSTIEARMSGRVVLVTGAAGSIGSEICRQLARFNPQAIVGFEVAETPLFQLQQEFARHFPAVPFHAEIGSIQNLERLAEVFATHRPSTVFHAAAFKHVPIMERHPFEAIENNVFGTLNVAQAAADHDVSDFVLISSDKAVRPTNVMGATKRVAEVGIRSLQHLHARPTFVAVRFGNVLGSNGSVVPIFKDQIAMGGPVTVTHPEMERYFMTIPEASQLVLQASTMGGGGEIFVLDMGAPVRIVDLARKLIFLSGLDPETVPITFSGVRPGEKLYEETNGLDEDTLPTSHPKIHVFAGNTIPWTAFEHELARLRRACSRRDVGAVVRTLTRLVPEYTPSPELLGRVAVATSGEVREGQDRPDGVSGARTVDKRLRRAARTPVRPSRPMVTPP
jgi:FlaA1/EpsC-like NDP-sugar epimerase